MSGHHKWSDIKHKKKDETINVPDQDAVHPGDKCPTCARRIPHPKKPNSPQSKVTAYRVPLDDSTAHDDIAQAAAEELGILDKPFWRWVLNSYCYAMVLQGARLEETGG